MARARFIRPEYFTDEKIGEMSFAARLLFIGTWCHADINGVLEWKAKQLRVLVFPHDENVKAVEVEKWMAEIVACGVVEVYSVGAATYGIVKNFHKHQTFTKSEHDGGSRHPTPSSFVSAPRNMSGHSSVRAGTDASACERADHSATVVLPPVAPSHDKPTLTLTLTPEPEPARAAPAPASPEQTLTAWVRWKTSDHERSQENLIELRSLIETHGIKTVQAHAERLAFAAHGKVWPNQIAEEFLKANAPTFIPPVLNLKKRAS
jgi:hypothetical protein